MKYILIGMIRVYQMLPLKSHNMCKFIPTCSNYAIEAIDKHGCLKGIGLSVKRIIKCNPRSTGGIDLVPERKIK